MSKKVELVIAYGNEPEADRYIAKACEIANLELIKVQKSYVSGSFTGDVILTFSKPCSAKAFRTAAKEMNGPLYMLDGVRFTEFDGVPANAPYLHPAIQSGQPNSPAQDASPPQTRSAHEERIEYWTQKKIQECRPRPVHGRATPASSALEGVTPETSSNFDTRAIQPTEYSVAPFNAVGKLNFTGVDWQTCTGIQPYSGSAWLIAPRIIMTVAHNFYETNCKNKSDNVVFFAGHGGPNAEAYSVIDFRYVPLYEFDPQFQMPNPAAVNDVGIGILDRAVASHFGTIPVITDGSQSLTDIIALGYPKHRENGLKMWMCDGKFLPNASNSAEFSMSSDFTGGSSGGPWIIETAEGWRSVGLQSGERPGNVCYSGRLGQQARDLIDWANSVVNGVA